MLQSKAYQRFKASASALLGASNSSSTTGSGTNIIPLCHARGNRQRKPTPADNCGAAIVPFRSLPGGCVLDQVDVAVLLRLLPKLSQAELDACSKRFGWQS